jgi:hypothetical protein
MIGVNGYCERLPYSIVIHMCTIVYDRGWLTWDCLKILQEDMNILKKRQMDSVNVMSHIYDHIYFILIFLVFLYFVLVRSFDLYMFSSILSMYYLLSSCILIFLVSFVCFNYISTMKSRIITTDLIMLIYLKRRFVNFSHHQSKNNTYTLVRNDEIYIHTK